MQYRLCNRWIVGALGLAAWLAVSGRAASPPHDPSTPTRLALISDLHVMVGTTNLEQPVYLGRLNTTIAAVNRAKVDLVVVAGDLTEHGTASELAAFRRQIRNLFAPVLFVPGNHDVGNKLIPGVKKDPTTASRTDAYEMENGRSFFKSEEAGVRIIGLNSCLLGSRLGREKQMWEFLEKELAQPAKVPTLLLLHHPPFLKKPDEAGGDYFNIEPDPRARLLALAKQGGVSAILSGHLHHGLTNWVNGMVLLTTPPVSFGLPKGKQPEGWTLVTVQGTNVTWDFQPLAPGRRDTRSP
ncbi:MAG: metallophosphoesterase [Verrucomicrobia bacterium]|nr:metallophosphoesterase [Verrucomicrobiota bacterium]